MADTEITTAPKENQVQPSTEESKRETNSNDISQTEEVASAIAGETVTADVTAPDGDGTAEAVVANTEPASMKDKKRKSAGGVPEHKAKKLNKKKSMPTMNLNCKAGEYYWARLKGYPPWPAIIADEEMLPETLLATRPVSTERADGTLRDDFKENGKNVKDRTYPIMFLSTNEFAWMPNTSLTALDPEECKTKSSKVSKALGAAYDLAAEHPDLDYYKRLLQQFQEETAVFEAEQRKKEAEAAEKAAAKAEKEAQTKEKKARKSKGGDDDIEMEDADAPKASKKRKNTESEGDAKTKKPPKITKLNAPKTNGDKKETAAKTKKADKPKAAEKKQELSEAELLQQREKGVLYLRHRLQKAFLSSDSAPKEEDMSGMNEFFNQLEGYDELEPSIIRTTKIHKVLKAIIKLNAVPKDDEYNFKKRSQTMLEAWNKRMEANGDVVTKSEKPATNGEAKVDSAKAEKQSDEIDKKVEHVDTTELKSEAPAPDSAKEEKTETDESKPAAAESEVKADDA